MEFASFGEFLRMGGHAPYVWASYGLTVVVLAGLFVTPLRRQRAFVRDERQRRIREDAGRTP